MLTKNPNLKRRRSQEGAEDNRKGAKPLEFEDLFNLKQKLLGKKDISLAANDFDLGKPFSHSSPMDIMRK